MASAADQLASSINLSKFSKATELKKRLYAVESFGEIESIFADYLAGRAEELAAA